MDEIISDIEKKSKIKTEEMPKFDRRRNYTLDQIIKEFENKKFDVPSDLMASPHGSEVQFVRQRKDPRDPQQDHWRVWKGRRYWTIESHVDRISPDMKKNPGWGIAGHAAVDVGAVTAARKMGKNWNNTDKFRLRRKK